MLLEKTLFNVDVLTVDLWVDEDTARQIRGLSNTRATRDSKRAAVTRAAMESEAVAIDLRFKRDVDLGRFLEGVRSSLAEAERAGMITASTRREVASRLPEWFQAVADRGFQKGDRLSYRISGDTVRTILVSRADEVLLEEEEQGADRRRALLAGYFAPGSDFRRSLVESVLDCAGE